MTFPEMAIARKPDTASIAAHAPGRCAHTPAVRTMRIAALLLVLLLAWTGPSASAMTFWALTLPEGRRIVLAEG